MAEPQKIILTIVDISGYTHFIKTHRASRVHAEEIIFDLLEAVIDRAEYPLTLNKLEGDALLLYAYLIPGEETAAARDVMRQIKQFFETFHTGKDELIQERAYCSCNACQRVGDLRLKAFLHRGEAFFRQIRHFDELAGEDVILIHRLLKNTIPAAEYIAVTPPFTALLGDYLSGIPAEIHREHYNDFGPVELKILLINSPKKEQV